MNNPVRFKDIPVNTWFHMWFGGVKALGYKINDKLAAFKKVNGPGFVETSIDPELNQDDCWTTHHRGSEWRGQLY